MQALPVSTYNGFCAESDREYTEGMRECRYFDGIVRSGMSDFHGSFREESREEQMENHRSFFAERNNPFYRRRTYTKNRCIDV